jgi:hypothetical protein
MSDEIPICPDCGDSHIYACRPRWTDDPNPPRFRCDCGHRFDEPEHRERQHEPALTGLVAELKEADKEGWP